MTISLPGEIASIVFAAGKGSRMVGYEGNKTLLPLVLHASSGSVYDGERPLLVEVLSNLPSGPKAIVVNHRADDVRAATEPFNCVYADQPVTNGTGGALLAARPFLESISHESVLITMGDVPLIRSATYENLVRRLDARKLVVLGFVPRDRAQYGMLELDGDRVAKIVEWKYWSTYAAARQAELRYCNAGVYAANRETLLQYMTRLEASPHKVRKKRDNEWVDIEEYFLTDIVELMGDDEIPTGLVEASEEEVMGVDTPESLQYAQRQYALMSDHTAA